ncbi:MAG TPA: LLM class flavin-dependent oxidoreductase [Longimicrobiaceae bacterium]|nr:LLM class flavin-dependent oxidoreductase [Longimicrobiaceae bacterium]
MALALSVLDLVPVGAGSSAGEAIRHSVELARLADRLGYVRYWLAEHHGMPSIASSSPEVLIEHLASATERIRVGSGGIMLPNHAPLRIAEAFHTLEALHPGRIDLGVGRAPGTDPATSSALRPFDAEQYPQQLAELVGLSRRTLPEDHPFHRVRVVPEDVALPPVWLLGSSGGTARLAGAMGMGYGFARHFSHSPPGPAIRAYRESFRPSEQFPEPHVVLGVAVICAETDERAAYLASSMELAWVRLQRGQLGPLPDPEEAAAHPYTPQERMVVESYRSLHFAGSPVTVRARLEALVEETGADEVMVTSMIHSHAERLRSYELLAGAFGGASEAAA